MESANDGTNYYALETFVDEVNLTSFDGGSCRS